MHSEEREVQMGVNSVRILIWLKDRRLERGGRRVRSGGCGKP